MKKTSDTETYTWDFLENNMAKVQLSSITELAELAHVSTATIVRTLKKKGFDGFPDYKNSLKRANHDLLIRVAGLSDEANVFVYRNLEEVVRTIGFLNTDSLADMVEAINKARQIVIVARDAGEDIGDDLMYRLQSIGKNVITRYYDNMEEYAVEMQADDLMIALSFTGQERIIIEAAKKVRRKNATVLALICAFPSELAKISNSYLLGYKSNLEKEIVAADEESSMPLELLCRILLDMYIIYKEKGSIRATK